MSIHKFSSLHHSRGRSDDSMQHHKRYFDEQPPMFPEAYSTSLNSAHSSDECVSGHFIEYKVIIIIEPKFNEINFLKISYEFRQHFRRKKILSKPCILTL